MQLKQKIEEQAYQLGFDLIGVAPAQTSPDRERFREWIATGNQADMRWMANNPERRCDPRRILSNAQSVVTVGMSYFTQDPPAELWNDPLRGRVARFAWGRDYHDVVTPRLEKLASFIDRKFKAAVPNRFYIDTGPILERSTARLSGIGYPGYNTNLIAPGLGSYILLGEVITSTQLEPDKAAEPFVASCESCRACLTSCPTNALTAPYVCDSRLCISYLTVEHKGSIPVEMRPLLGNWIFGCDACQECCPHNMKRIAPARKTSFLQYEPSMAAPPLLDLIELDDQQFRNRFKNTPIQRTKRRGLLRNVAVALGNSRNKAALPALEKATQDDEELIREHALWAIEQINPKRLRSSKDEDQKGDIVSDTSSC